MKSCDRIRAESVTRFIRVVETISIIIVVLSVLVVLAQAFPRGALVSDLNSQTWQTPSWTESADDAPYPFHRPITNGAITLYQKLISPARGSSCPMHPHCSQYSREAFANYNPIRAYVMTADRLLRCGHDLNQYRPTSVDGQPRYFDPIAVAQAFGGRTIFASTTGDSEPADDTNIESQLSAERAASGSGISDSLLFNFASQLQTDGDYERAVTEYLRLVSYYPNSRYSARAKVAAVQCYHAAGSYPQAVAYGESLLLENSDATVVDQIKFLVGVSNFKTGDLELALSSFTELAESAGDFREKGVMAQGLTHAHLHDWTAAARSFETIDDASELSMKARGCARLSLEGADLGYKNPNVAALLAIVPGLGYLYDGYYSTALSALLVNGLFMWSAYEAYRQDHNVLGATLTMFGIGWYAGNIYGSAYSAVRQNDKRRHDHLLKFDLGFKF